MFLPIAYFFKERVAISLVSIVLVFIIILGCEDDKAIYFEEGKKNINGAELYYKIMGKGEPIVVLHGGPGLEHTYLLPQMGKLSQRYQLIFYDQRATGGSIAGTDSSSITLDNFVKDLEGIRMAFDLDKMNLLGHSWGGMLAMFYGIKYPQNVNSLMLIGSGGARSDFWDDLYYNINRKRTTVDSLALTNIRVSEKYKNNDVATLAKFYKTFFKPYFYDQDLADSLSTTFTDRTLHNSRIIWERPLAHEVDNYDIRDQLSIIKSPTLIIHGDSDVIPVKYAEEIHNRLENSDLVILEQCGHFPYIEVQDRFFRLISNFMDEISKK